MKKQLGKIQEVTFGIGGYQDGMLGIHFTLGDGSWGVQDYKCSWDSNRIKHSEYTKWTENDRSDAYVEIMRYVSDLLHQAKVTDITQLQGIPIEAEFEGRVLKSWRILTEVL